MTGGDGRAPGGRLVSEPSPRVSAEPPGWPYNPSNWSQRAPVVVLALIAGLISTHLALYQLDVIDTVFEPFFGDGTRVVLESEVGHLLPIPDAALGALAYFADAALGAVGGRRRWRTQPWIVLLFALVVVLTGVTGVLLLILQPVLYGVWCTPCLVTSAISVAIVGPAITEALASLQHLGRARRRGDSLAQALRGKAASERTSG